jgi:FkbM family methyltransferase
MYNRLKILSTDLPIKKELLGLFKQKERLLVFDIGSCEGEDSIRYAKLFPNASIFSFEPLPKNQDLIVQNIIRYNAANVRLFKMALSNYEGWQNLHVSSGHPNNEADNINWDFGNKSSSLLEPDNVLDTIKWLKFETIIPVYTTTLRNIVIENKIDVIDFIHMDVQGAELLVLTGAGNHIENIKAIWLEIAEIPLYNTQPLRRDVEQFMMNNKFKLIKTEIENGVGDQLYINTRFYRTSRFFDIQRFKRVKPVTG